MVIYIKTRYFAFVLRKAALVGSPEEFPTRYGVYAHSAPCIIQHK